MQQKRLTKRDRRNLQRSLLNEDQSKMYMRDFAPITDRQDDTAMAWNDGSNCIALIGSAGTGKTYMAAALGLRDVIENNCMIKSFLSELRHSPGIRVSCPGQCRKR